MRRWVVPRGGKRLRAGDGHQNLVGERVRQRRNELGLTQSLLTGRLAFVTGGHWNPTPQEVLSIEQGYRAVLDTELVALALALSCDVRWLLFGEEPKLVIPTDEAAMRKAILPLDASPVSRRIPNEAP